MSDTFDSRALTYTDCYGQRFMKPGRYRYHALPTGNHLLSDERPYLITVKASEDDKKMNQHTVRLHWDGRRFEPDHAEITIGAGDLVVWNCPQRLAMPYVLVGDKKFFGSSTLVNECGYSHAFGLAGTYEWTDALGREIGGTVIVNDPEVKTDADIAAWRQRLTQGTLVMIADGKAQPDHVEIITGQTVYFAVVTGPTTVTDRRLLRSNRPDNDNS